jgi:hypothetical protein
MAVYIIRAGEDGPVKIGVATDTRDRLVTLQMGNHLDLKIIREIEGWEAAEAAIHARYSHLRLRGEWFTFCPSMLTEQFDVDPSPTCRHKQDSVCPIVKRVAQAAGGYAALARIVGVSRMAVPQWRHGIPTYHLHKVAAATGLPIEELIP